MQYREEICGQVKDNLGNTGEGWICNTRITFCLTVSQSIIAICLFLSVFVIVLQSVSLYKYLLSACSTV